MSNAVLISIRPRWCERIASGEKTIEVRKNRPKIDTPFRCYIYETRGYERVGNENLNCIIGGNGRGKVIGEFMCDEIVRYARFGYGNVPARYMKASPGGYPATEIHFFDLQLSPAELEDYGEGAPLYGWHITDLKLYAEPMEINEFKRWNRTEQTAPCAHVYALYSPCESCTECNLKRAPQSWCYIEEVE